jgi:hypothetical protein
MLFLTSFGNSHTWIPRTTPFRLDRPNILTKPSTTTVYTSKMEESNLQPGQNLAHLLPPSWKADVQRWYAEDTPSFDWAGFVVGEEEQEAILWGKSGVGSPYILDLELMIRVFLLVSLSLMRYLLMPAARTFYLVIGADK